MYTYFVNIDVDNATMSLSDFLERPIMKPTIAYTTFSNGKDGLYSYRLLYCFEEKIQAQDYERLYNHICGYIGQSKTKDHCGRVLSQLMNGNSLPDIETYMSHRIYEMSDFVQKSFLELYCYRDNIKYNSKKPDYKNYSNPKESDNDVSNEIISDLRNLELSLFMAKYSCLGIVEQTKLDFNEHGYCLIPDSYYKVFNRIKWTDKKAHIDRFRDREGRRNRLFEDACVIRKIEPEITFDKMLYNLVHRRMYFYDNSDHVLTNEVLIEKAKSALAKPLSYIDRIEPSQHGKFTTSKEYCVKHNLKRRSYSRKVQRELNYQSIGEWYDLGLSVSENLAYARQNNIKVSLSTLKNFCKDNEIDPNPRYKPVESWYDSALSVSANYQYA